MKRIIPVNIPTDYFNALVRCKRDRRVQLLFSKTVHEAAKSKAAKIGCSLNEYVIKCIIKDLEQE